MSAALRTTETPRLQWKRSGELHDRLVRTEAMLRTVVAEIAKLEMTVVELETRAIAAAGRNEHTPTQQLEASRTALSSARLREKTLTEAVSQAQAAIEHAIAIGPTEAEVETFDRELGEQIDALVTHMAGFREAHRLASEIRSRASTRLDHPGGLVDLAMQLVPLERSARLFEMALSNRTLLGGWRGVF